MLLLCCTEMQQFRLSSDLFEFGFERFQNSNENISKHQQGMLGSLNKCINKLQVHILCGLEKLKKNMPISQAATCANHHPHLQHFQSGLR